MLTLTRLALASCSRMQPTQLSRALVPLSNDSSMTRMCAAAFGVRGKKKFAGGGGGGGGGGKKGSKKGKRQDDDDGDNDDEDDVGGQGGAADTSALKGVNFERLAHDLDASVAALKRDMAAFRVGRANPQLLHGIHTPDPSGKSLPLTSLGSVVVRDASTLVFTAYDQSTVPEAIKVLNETASTFSAAGEGHKITIALPKVTKELRQEWVKTVRSLAETTRVRMRRARAHAIKAAQGIASKDDRKRDEQKVEDLTKAAGKTVDKLLDDKVKQLQSS